MRRSYRSYGETSRRLAKLTAPLGGPMALAVLCGVAGNLCAIFMTVLGAYGLLEAAGIWGGMPLAILFMIIALFAALRGVLRYGEQQLNHWIAFKLLALFRERVFEALRRLSPAKLEGRDKGDLISLITADIEQLEVFYAHTISPVAIAVIVSAGMCVFLGRMHPLFAFIAALAYLTVGAALPRITAKEEEAAGREFRQGLGELNSYVLDSLRGIAQSIQYGNGWKRLQGINDKTELLSQKERELRRLEGKSAARMNLAVVAFPAAALVCGILLFENGSVGFSDLLIAAVAMLSSFGPVIALSAVSHSLAQTFASANRLFDLLDEEPAVAEVTEGIEPDFEGMECDRLTFAYGEEKILDDFSLAIKKNRITGITGRSGSGKSTLLKLLMRFWDTDRGRVLLSGEDIKMVNTRRLRELQGYMTQETQLFDDTLLGNIRIAKANASPAEVEAACRKASLHGFVASLPDGYQTPVGELGARLSGGEKQRIGLARAFLHDSPLILLDEPTSSLDSLNEAVILKSLYETGGGKTVVLVSHRKSTMRVADEVYSAGGSRPLDMAE